MGKPIRPLAFIDKRMCQGEVDHAVYRVDDRAGGFFYSSIDRTDSQ